jgi:hypothetical protein
MTRDELTERVVELFPPLAEVKPWHLGETDEGEPVVAVERRASFTGLDSRDVDLTAPIPNTTKIGVWRIDTSNAYTILALAEDPIAAAAPSSRRTTSPRRLR